MNIYSFVLFLHIAGALGFFVTLGLEWTSLRQIRNATTSEQVRAWMNISSGTRRLGMASMLTIVIAGLYLCYREHRHKFNDQFLNFQFSPFNWPES